MSWTPGAMSQHYRKREAGTIGEESPGKPAISPFEPPPGAVARDAQRISWRGVGGGAHGRGSDRREPKERRRTEENLGFPPCRSPGATWRCQVPEGNHGFPLGRS